MKLLFHTCVKQQGVLIETITKIQMRIIIEIVFNALQGNLTISEKDLSKLKRYKAIIRQLVSLGLSFKKRKELLLKYFKQILLLITPCEKWLKN